MILGRDFGRLVLPLALLVSLGLNVNLGWRVNTLQRVAVRQLAAGFHPGDTLSTLPIRTGSAGGDLTIERPTVLYVFSPKCEWCMRDHDNIVAISNAIKDKYTFIAVTQDVTGLDAYLKQYPFPGEVVTADPSRFDALHANAIRPTPQLLVLDSTGRVERTWSGALMETRLTSAEDFFRVKLPGVRALPEDGPRVQ